ncbi:VWA domain-containing protein, partial [Ruminococcaceae bacterium OttesenSCG-928-O06]|nr:VWA domain-containing protein [Ruminococcaceae bacterium OttesenSCG-928-O06]
MKDTNTNKRTKANTEKGVFGMSSKLRIGKKAAALVLTLMMLMTLVPVSIFADPGDVPDSTSTVRVDQVNGASIVYDASGKIKTVPAGYTLQEGEVRLSKTATAVDGVPNQFDITLQVEAQAITSVAKAAEIVLVIDRSNSMTGSGARTLTCTKPTHSHGGSSCTYACGLDEHTHSTRNCGYGCGLEAHTHEGVGRYYSYPKRSNRDSFTVGCYRYDITCSHNSSNTWSHSASCYNAVLVCDEEAHTHSIDACGYGCNKVEHSHSSCSYTCEAHSHAFNYGNGCYDYWLRQAREAAKSMVDGFVSAEVGVQMGIVEFGTTGSITKALTNTATGSESIKTAIDTIRTYQDGGTVDSNAGATNLESGIKVATGMFSNNPDTYKVIVVISDGEPTTYNGDTSGTGSDSSSTDKSKAIAAATAAKGAGIIVH